jgi:hypothetical protein
MTWIVGPVQSTSFGTSRGYGFNIIEEGRSRSPLLTLVYENITQANDAAKLVQAALVEAVYVATSLR